MPAQRILFVEDEDPVRKMIAGFLERRGYEVLAVKDGIEALQAIRGAMPDLVVTDVNMPNMNGLELTRRLRGHHRTARLPIVMLSAMKDESDVLAGYAEGADEYAPKPIELSVLVAKIETLLRRAGGPGGPRARGRLFMFIPGKGGVGTTTLAGNVAAALAGDGRGRVSILDLNFEFPAAAMFFNMRPRHTLADLSDGNGRPDQEDFEMFVSRDPRTGVEIVTGADVPERAELVTIPAVNLAIDRLRERSEIVLADSPPSFSERNLTALDLAEMVCLVTSPHLPAIKATLDWMKVLQKIEFPEGRLALVVNQTTPKGFPVQDIERVFKRRLDAVIPYSDLFDQCANDGHPLVAAHGGHPASKELRDLGGRLASP